MVGIDIGSKTIKIVELSKEGGSHSLNASGVVSYSGNAVEKMADEKEFAALGSIVKKLHAEAGVSEKNATLSIPEPQVFTRTIRFPLLTDAEIASAVKWESEQYIPIPVAEAIIQHSILRRDETSTPPEVLVLLVAAPRAVVEKYTKIVTSAGLTPVAVETELMAITRALAPADKTVLILDFGANSTNIAIAKNSLLSFSRSIPIAGEAFTRAVSQGLGIAPMQAEEYKKTYGLAESQLEGKIKTALDPVLRLVVDEIKKAINYYQTEEKGEAPGVVIVSGGTSGMPQIISRLSALLGTEVSVANPFGKIKIDPETAKKLAPYAPLYSVAVGLALREE
ncbi:MAG: type IV pilus assembly protein PilM, nonfunctional [Candidatus Woesebacteria bacterium GW2011_GWB1_45_5]|uniref:Type IV pilus assembly protein PilM, nonfunctional n=1 Tax=Candidatus Woesebacteria bacterium GW2011_GWB1_45_5 TaxID=1618581 RepID=A0A0G1MLG9_9BACT|nr:MAG: type IV pilus assembly protein PilM, nonfunctional [Candidatus Woesebacteria bacterium GW2011_GWB1_45_5]